MYTPIFRFTYAEKTLPTAAAERILDAFCQTLCTINESNGEDEIASVFPRATFDISNLFLPGHTNATSSDRNEYSITISPSVMPVAESIKSFWTQVLCVNKSTEDQEIRELMHEDSFLQHWWRLHLCPRTGRDVHERRSGSDVTRCH